MQHGEMIAAGEHFERALALATDPQVRARLQCEAASSLVATGDQRGVEYVRDALRILDPVANPLETANALSMEARFHHLAGRHRTSLELLTRAAHLVAPAAESDSVSTFAAPVISQIYAFLAGAHQHYGLYDDADYWARRAIEFGEKQNVLFGQAIGLEFLAEDAVHAGNFKKGLEYAERELEITERLHSRERRAWSHFAAAMCLMGTGDYEGAELKFTAGIELAELIGEPRVGSLLKANLAVLQAHQASRDASSNGDHGNAQSLLDQALRTALENFEKISNSGLIYSRFEGYRCLAEVRFRRGELDEAESLCDAASELVSKSESRVSKLWLGPLYIEVFLAGSKHAELAAKEAEAENDSVTAIAKRAEAAAKRAKAAEHLAQYQELVVDCQSPRFKREAQRLTALLENN